MNADVMDLAARFAADPRFRLAYAGVAGETAPAQRMQGGAQGYAEPVSPPMAIPIPGQTAQAVMPGGMSPEQRIGGAFEAAGQNPAPSIPPELLIAAALQQAQGRPAPGSPPSISGGPSMPGARPAFEPSSGNGWVGQMMSSVGAEPEAGPLGRMLPAGIRNPLSDALSSLGGIDSTAPALSAFGQGFAGASSSRAAREDRKRAEQAATQDAAWKAEDRAFKREDRTYEREDRAHDRRRDVIEDRQEDDKVLRDKRRAMIEEASTAAGIYRTRAETAKIEREYSRAGLSAEEAGKIEDRVTARMNALLGTNPDDAEIAEIKPELDLLRKGLIDAEMAELAGETTDSGGTSNVEGNGISGEGSYDSPFTGGEAAVNAAIDAAPPGTTIYFLDENGKRRAEER